MKIVYTDRYGIRIWCFLFMSLWMGYTGIARDVGLLKIMSLIAGACWAYQVFKELSRRRFARLKGEDSSIYKVVDDAPHK